MRKQVCSVTPQSVLTGEQQFQPSATVFQDSTSSLVLTSFLSGRRRHPLSCGGHERSGDGAQVPPHGPYGDAEAFGDPCTSIPSAWQLGDAFP